MSYKQTLVKILKGHVKAKVLKNKNRYDKALDELKRFDKLVTTHPAKQFIHKRFIPKEHWDKFYLCSNFYEWTN